MSYCSIFTRYTWHLETWSNC